MKRGAGSPLDHLSLSSRFGEQAMPEELGDPVVTISRPPAEKQAKRATVTPTPTAAHSAKPKVVSPPAEKQAARGRGLPFTILTSCRNPICSIMAC
jgi:hypothetical protein